MHLLIAAQKAILNNPQSTPEQKERAVSELRGIPVKDPRYADAQRVLSGLGFAVAETVTPEAKPSPTPDKPDKRRYMPMTNAMFWLSMNEMQEAVNEFQGELEAESDRLAQIMSEWATTKDEELLNAFADAAPFFVEKSLAALCLTWEQVQFQLRCWAAIQLGMNRPDVDKELLELAKEETPVLQATALITKIWPTIKRTLQGWNEKADAVGMDRVMYGRMNVTDRTRALYRMGGHPLKGLPNKGTEAQP